MHGEIHIFMEMSKALKTSSRIDLKHSCAQSDEVPLRLVFDWTRDTESDR